MGESLLGAVRSVHTQDGAAGIGLLGESGGRRVVGTFATRMTDSGAVVFCPTGRMNLTTARAVRDDLHELVAGGGRLVVVDLSGVEMIDSSGLGAVISGLKAARQVGGDLRIAAPNRPVLMVWELTKLTRVLIPYQSVEDALAGRM